jgi:hypothetical protein
MALTAIHSLNKPTAGTKPWTTDVNANWDIIDGMYSATNTVPTAGIANNAVDGTKIELLFNVGLEQKDTGGTARVILNLATSDITTLYDGGGNESLECITTASAVNHFSITNAATGAGAIITAAGSDTNIDARIQSKGTGLIKLQDDTEVTGYLAIQDGATGPGELRVLEDSDNGTNYVGFKAPAAITASVVFELPDGDGTSGQAMTTNASGVLAWTTVGSTGVNFLAIPAAQANVTGDGTNYTVTWGGSEPFDTGSDFDGTSTFTAPSTGQYQFNVILEYDQYSNTNHSSTTATLVASNRTLRLYRTEDLAADGSNTLSASVLVDMDAADTVVIKLNVAGASKVIDIGSNGSFSGFLI